MINIYYEPGNTKIFNKKSKKNNILSTLVYW